MFGRFALRRGYIPQRGVTTLVVVENLDGLDERRTGLSTGREVGALDEFLLHGRGKPFHGSDIPAIGPPAYAARNAVLGRQTLAVFTDVLAAAILCASSRSSGNRRRTVTSKASITKAQRKVSVAPKLLPNSVPEIEIG